MKLYRNVSFRLLTFIYAGLSVIAFSMGAHAASTHQELASSASILVDLSTNQVLHAQNENQVMPIASVTKLMTAYVVLDAGLDLDEQLEVTIKQAFLTQQVFSRVRLGSSMSRRELLLLALMSSENRAAATLAHHYPQGYWAFIQDMNKTAKKLGMHRSHFVEPTGLSSENVSTASDLVRLLKASKKYPLLGELSTTQSHQAQFSKPRYSLGFGNTNRLVSRDSWDIALSKTGFTNDAGRCLVMRTEMANRQVAFVALDSFGKYTHMEDAKRLKSWLETGKVSQLPQTAKDYKYQRRQDYQAQVLARISIKP
ncbi:D-alanyl-D-alanine endopeptidase [Alginatibacterium sediminis]|uniref:D-alanyl-D-alanine endopeptidase n=1 Tax=Alginatibacterium sediminis TaxID=2164068 RepID=A0A420EBP2_9ALTE|nr:D-alanyl-D-alanine endopeptidase [Alginatibacterium sediminis]RKF18096.1 D-alanyl-D-alanine endopeptidase [Alginatibacterium sediminis]